MTGLEGCTQGRGGTRVSPIRTGARLTALAFSPSSPLTPHPSPRLTWTGATTVATPCRSGQGAGLHLRIVRIVIPFQGGATTDNAQRVTTRAGSLDTHTRPIAPTVSPLPSAEGDPP